MCKSYLRNCGSEGDEVSITNARLSMALRKVLFHNGISTYCAQTVLFDGSSLKIVTGISTAKTLLVLFVSIPHVIIYCCVRKSVLFIHFLFEIFFSGNNHRVYFLAPELSMRKFLQFIKWLTPEFGLKLNCPL